MLNITAHVFFFQKCLLQHHKDNLKVIVYTVYCIYQKKKQPKITVHLLYRGIIQYRAAINFIFWRFIAQKCIKYYGRHTVVSKRDDIKTKLIFC